MYINKWYVISKNEISQSEIENHKQILTIQPKKMGDEVPEPMYCFVETDKEFMVPINYGIQNYGMVDNRLNDKCGLSYPNLPDPNHPKAPKNQDLFIDNIMKMLRTKNRGTVLAETGTGKTASSLSCIGQLGARAIVIVPTLRLAEQWKQEIQLKLGLKEENIGWVQGDKCDYKNKHVTIAVMKSAAMHKYEDDFYDYFSMLVLDEADRFPTGIMSNVFGAFNAKYQIPMSATLERKDGRSELLRLWYGDVAVKAQGLLPEPIIVLPFKYIHNKQSYTSDRNGNIAELGRNFARNNVMSGAIKTLYDKDRTILGISDSVKQLMYIKDRLVSQGVPEDKVCIFADQLYTDDKMVSIKLGDNLIDANSINSKTKEIFEECNVNVRATYKSLVFTGKNLHIPSVRQSALVATAKYGNISGDILKILHIKNDNGVIDIHVNHKIDVKNNNDILKQISDKFNVVLTITDHDISITFNKQPEEKKYQKIINKLFNELAKLIPVSFDYINGEMKVKPQMLKLTRTQIDEMLTDQSMRIYLATYGAMKMGIDVPWINAGIDLTPRAEGRQVIGRIRRPWDDTISRWYTPIDIGFSNLVQNINRSRLNDYQKSQNLTLNTKHME